MTPNQPPLVEQQLDNILTVHDPNGNKHELVQRRETILLNPNTGERQFVNHDVVYTSIEGRLIDPKHYTLCARCNAQPLSHATQCTDCKKYLCATCTHHGRCRKCYVRHRFREFTRWITTL